MAHRRVHAAEAQEVILPAFTDCRFYGRYYDIPSLSYGATGGGSHGFRRGGGPGECQEAHADAGPLYYRLVRIRAGIRPSAGCFGVTPSKEKLIGSAEIDEWLCQPCSRSSMAARSAEAEKNSPLARRQIALAPRLAYAQDRLARKIPSH